MKNGSIRIRIGEDDREKLDYLSKNLNISKSRAIRDALNVYYAHVKRLKSDEQNVATN